MNGRGYCDQRYARNEGAQVFQVKKSSVAVRDNGKEKVQKESANDKMNTDVNGMSSSGKKKVGNKGMGTDSNAGKKDKNKKIVSSNNMFSALTDERDIEMHGEWESMRSRIDEACEKGLHISLEEKNDWNDDLRRQIVHSNKMIAIESRNKANVMMKSVMVEQGLTQNQAYGKIYEEVYKDELDRIKDLSLKLQLAETELFFMTGQVFTINEWNDWSYEKLEFYKASIGEEGLENILKVLNIDRNEDMDDEVAEERSASAQFIV
ncbi:hypothetical protein Tco_0067428 [Tanacetum coccineum]